MEKWYFVTLQSLFNLVSSINEIFLLLNKGMCPKTVNVLTLFVQPLSHSPHHLFATLVVCSLRYQIDDSQRVLGPGCTENGVVYANNETATVVCKLECRWVVSCRTYGLFACNISISSGFFTSLMFDVTLRVNRKIQERKLDSFTPVLVFPCGKMDFLPAR